MDVDGDGITDIVQISTDRNGVLQATPFLASVKDEQTKYAAGTACLLGVSEGPIPDLPRRLQRQRHDGSGRCLSAAGEIGLRSVPVDWNGIFEVADHRDIGPWQQGWINVYAIDANADGRTDMVVAYRNRSGLLAFDTYLSTPLGGGVALSATALTTVTQSQAPANRDALLAFDVNGDGMVDMVLLWNDRNQVLNATSFVSQGDQSASNGIKLFSKAVSSNLNVSTLHQVAILPADANGDGVVDLVQVSQSSAVLSIQSFLSDANGGFVARPASTFPGQSVSASSLLPMGVNGGAQTCLVNCWRDVGGVLHATEYGSMPDGQFRLVAEINTGRLRRARQPGWRRERRWQGGSALYLPGPPEQRAGAAPDLRRQDSGPGQADHKRAGRRDFHHVFDPEQSRGLSSRSAGRLSQCQRAALRCPSIAGTVPDAGGDWPGHMRGLGIHPVQRRKDEPLCLRAPLRHAIRGRAHRADRPGWQGLPR